MAVNEGMQNVFAPPGALVDDHVPPEAAMMVEATRLSRFLAFLIDCSPGFVVGIVAAVFAGIYGATHAGDGFKDMLASVGLFVGLFALAMIGWMIYNIVLVYRYGQIFGKRMMGIRVVRTDGSRVSFARFIFLRWLPLAILGGIIGAILGGAGHQGWSYVVGLADILFIFGSSKRCLHDLIADTIVVTAETSESATLAGSGRALRSANF